MIIDTHAHIGKMLNFRMPLKMLLRSVEKYGIDFTLFSDIEAAEFDHKGRKVPRIFQKSQRKILDDSIRFARAHSDKLGALIWIKLYENSLDGEFWDKIRENRDVIYGLKLHPFHSRVAPDDPALEPVYAHASELGLPIVSHTGGCEEARSIHLYNAAKAHPEINFVMVHMDLGTDNREALELLGKLTNLYGDTTWVPVNTTLEAIRRCGSKKMLFGTDNPIDGEDTLLHNKTGDRSLYQEYFIELKEKLREEEYENLMWRNAAEVFQLRVESVEL